MPLAKQPHEHSNYLQLIEDAPPPPELPREEAAAEAVRREFDKLELDRLRIINKELQQNTEQRKSYATRLFCVMVGWLAVVAYVILAQGFGVGFHEYGRFHLADGVVIALITTTTATVIGVFLTVANYLFPKRDQAKDD